MFHACLRNHPGFTAQQVSNAIIRKAEFLGFPEEFSPQTLNRVGRMPDKGSFKIHQLSHLIQEPGIDFRRCAQFLVGQPQTHGVGQVPQSLG